MAKWLVKYELRSTHTWTVRADNAAEAEKIVCDEAWWRHGESIFKIFSTKQKEENDDQ